MRIIPMGMSNEYSRDDRDPRSSTRSSITKAIKAGGGDPICKGTVKGRQRPIVLLFIGGGSEPGALQSVLREGHPMHPPPCLPATWCSVNSVAMLQGICR
jgi:hypothetical protein